MESGNSPSDAVSAGRRLAARFTNPPRTFWIILAIALLFAAVGISIGGILSFSHSSAQGYVCYRPAEQRACYLRTMDHEDRETTQVMLSATEQRGDTLLLQNNQTKYYREFLGIVAGEQVDPKGLGEAIQTLCEQMSIFWVRRADGPGKQRLIYLCIDICFPSNICVSICFYYLPE